MYIVVDGMVRVHDGERTLNYLGKEDEVAERTDELGQLARVFKRNEGFHDLIQNLHLDFLLIDTHPGLNEEILLSIALSDTLVIILRPDQQDIQGTGGTVQVARQLGVPEMTIVVNKLPYAFDPEDVKLHVEQTYQCPVSAVLLHSDEIMTLASSSIFALRFPDDPVTKLL